VGLEDTVKAEDGTVHHIRLISNVEAGWRYEVFSADERLIGFLFLHRCDVPGAQWRLAVLDVDNETVWNPPGVEGQPRLSVPGWAASAGCQASAFEALIELRLWMSRPVAIPT